MLCVVNWERKDEVLLEWDKDRGEVCRNQKSPKAQSIPLSPSFPFAFAHVTQKRVEWEGRKKWISQRWGGGGGSIIRTTLSSYLFPIRDKAADRKEGTGKEGKGNWDEQKRR